MEKEPLLPSYGKIPRTPSLLCTLPEDNQISIPAALTPSEFKDMLIFGSPRDPSSSSSSHIVDAVTLNDNNHNESKRPFSSSSDSNQDSKPIPVAITPDTNRLMNCNCPFKKKCLHRSKTAPAITINEIDQPSKPKPPQLVSPSIIRQSVVLLILYLLLGVIIYWYNRKNFMGSETHVVIDALYFCIVTS